MSKFNSLKKQLNRIEVNKSASINFSDDLLFFLSESLLKVLGTEKEIDLLFNGKCSPLLEASTNMSIDAWCEKIRDMAISKGLRKEIMSDYKQGEFSSKTLYWLHDNPTKEALTHKPVAETSKEIEAFFLVGS